MAGVASAWIAHQAGDSRGLPLGTRIRACRIRVGPPRGETMNRLPDVPDDAQRRALLQDVVDQGSLPMAASVMASPSRCAGASGPTDHHGPEPGVPGHGAGGRSSRSGRARRGATPPSGSLRGGSSACASTSPPWASCRCAWSRSGPRIPPRSLERGRDRGEPIAPQALPDAWARDRGALRLAWLARPRPRAPTLPSTLAREPPPRGHSAPRADAPPVVT
jgi:hypothetical protein